MKEVDTQTRAKAGSWKRLIPPAIGVSLLAAIVGGLLPKPLEVETAKIQSGPLTVFVLEEGKTRIRHRHLISPAFPGYLKRIGLRAGDPIEAGKTVLAELQPEWSGFLNPRAQAEAEARVKATEAARMRSEVGVERARASLALSEKEQIRAESLKHSGSISTREWDAALSQVEVLSQELRAAEFSKRVSEFEEAQAQVALKQAQAPSSEITQPYRILAPISGFVLNVLEENARLVAPGTPLLEVGDPKDLEAEIELLSSDAVGVRPGASVLIEQWGGERPLPAKVTTIEPGGYTKISALGVEEQRVKVRVDFSEPLPMEHILGDRFRVEARIVTWSSPGVLQVPTGALFRRGGEWLTFVVENGRARTVKVEITHNNGVNAEVRSGLQPGQIVVLHAPDALGEGKAVRARQPAGH